ncbi:MAG: putative O-glycosylation ligase, exosortase A system-associated [Massilia sp.]
MRDIVITLLVFGSLPYIFKRPWFGVVMWIWISVMNPHRLSYGFAYSFPFAAVIAAVTIIGLVVTKDDKRMPKSAIVWVIVAFAAHMGLTTLTAFYPATSFELYVRIVKTLLMVLVAMMLIKTREQIVIVVSTLVGSLAYYGVKGGLFTVLTGGSFIVWGPEGSYIEGNNEIALAFITIIPMMYFLFQVATNKWVKRGLLVSMVFCGMAALGSYSRGALVGIAAMLLYFWWKSPKKVLMGAVLLALIPIGVLFMPAKWTQRMDTINTYQQDASAMGRINAWGMAKNLALDRPLVGGGFDIWTQPIFRIYGPIPEDVHAAHSIYFQVLGEHGFPGLILYLLLGILTVRRCSWLIKVTAKRDDLRWAGQLGMMVQVSLLGFGVGGAFLSLVYYDVPYYLIAIVVCTGYLVEQTLKAEAKQARVLAQEQQRRDLAPQPVAAKALS